MKKAYLTLDKIQKLQETIGFLNTYKPTEGEIHHIGANINSEDVKETNLLRELGRINERREKIIDELMIKNIDKTEKV